MNLSTRLMAAMVTLVLVAAAAVGVLTYRNLEAIALPSALERMEMHTRILATELEAPIIAARADVNTQGRLVQGVVRASLAGGRDPLDGTPEAQWRSALASRFTAELAAKPAYARFGLVGIADGGREIVRVGEVLSGANDRIASIYTGPSFVLAYIPESYLFDVEEGQKVAVKARGQTIVGDVEKVLPVTEALPPEFQLPNRARGRGQLVRIALPGKAEFAMDQKAHVSGCLFENCKTGVSAAVKAATPALQRFADTAGRMIGGLKDFAVALGRDAITTPASAETAHARQGVSPTPR
jgi:hypothetical protein